MKPVHRPGLPVIFSTLFSVAVITYMMRQLDWSEVRSTLVGLKWGWVALAFTIHVLNYVFRTMRLQIILPLKKIRFGQLFGLNGLYGMYNYVLPVGSGEVTLVALLKYHLQVSVTDGLASLIATRYFDFSVISLFIPVVLVANHDNFPSWVIYSSLVFCALVFLVNILLFYFLRTSSIFSWSIFRSQAFWIVKLRGFLIKLQGGLIQIYQKREYLRLLLLTLAIWFCVYTNYYLIVVSLGYQMTYFQIIVVSIIMIPMTLLPIQGFANFGTHEIGWVIAFSIFDQQKDTALNVAFSSHVLLLFFVLVLGICSYLIASILYTENVLQA